jgi:adenylate cyclase
MPDAPGRTVNADTRRLAAIMFTDIVGFSRQMGSDEARTFQLLEVHNQFIQHAVSEHHGTVIKTIGDAFLVDFPSVVNAVQCAQTIQTRLRVHNTDKDSAEQIHVRVGIHLGDIVQKDGDVFGDGVNIASRLQGLAEPDTICISDVVYRDVAKKLALGTVVSLGRPKLKNIAERFEVYALLAEPPKGLWQTLRLQRLKPIASGGHGPPCPGCASCGGTTAHRWRDHHSSVPLPFRIPQSGGAGGRSLTLESQFYHRGVEAESTL